MGDLLRDQAEPRLGRRKATAFLVQSTEAADLCVVDQSLQRMTDSSDRM